MEKVYVVSSEYNENYDYNGGNISGIFKTLELAKDEANKVQENIKRKWSMGEDVDYKWVRCNETKYHYINCIQLYKLSYKEDDDEEYVDSCYAGYICEWELTDYPKNIKSSPRS